MKDEQLEEFEKLEAALEARLKAVRSAKAAYINRLLAESSTSKVSATNRGTTIKEEVSEILKGYPDGLTALEILEHLKRDYRPHLLRETLSPQLSRLKKSGKLTSYNKIWRLNHE